jgi:hypothetical protein
VGIIAAGATHNIGLVYDSLGDKQQASNTNIQSSTTLSRQVGDKATEATTSFLILLMAKAIEPTYNKP